MSEAQDLYLAGLKAYGEGKHADALDCYAKALEIDPTSNEILQALAMAQMHLGKLEEALKNALKLTELTPNDPLAFTSLSMIYQRLDKIEEAEKAQAKARMISWKEELKTNPDAPPPQDPGGMNVVQ